METNYHMYNRPEAPEISFARHGEDRNDADEVIQSVLPRLTNEEARKLIGLYKEYEQPFVAYLLLDETELTTPSLEQDFLNDYYSFHEAHQTTAEWYADQNNWEEGLDYFRNEYDVPETVVSIDWNELEDHLESMYDSTELDGYIFLFYK